MRIQVVLHEPATLHLRVMLGKPLWHTCRSIGSRSLGAHGHIPKPRLWLDRQEDPARSMLRIFIMVTFGLARTHGQDGTHISHEQAWAFVNTDQRAPWISRQGILLQDGFHMPQVITRHRTNTPLCT
jgi:hypothetical protein